MIRKIRMALCRWMYPGSWSDLIWGKTIDVPSRLIGPDHEPMEGHITARHPFTQSVMVPAMTGGRYMLREYELSHVVYTFDVKGE